GEAVRRLRRGLAVLGTLPEGPARDERERGLQLLLGTGLSGTKGFGSPEAADAYARVGALGGGLGEPLQVVGLPMGLCMSALTREGPAAARPLADQALAAAEREGVAPLRVWAQLAQAVTSHHAGDLAGARE